ncbi:MAG: dipeptidase [Clostridia bacterium]|nr:dipeptidase [Clostridia bacterium]
MSFPVADAHCDFLYYMYNEKYDLNCAKQKQMISRETLENGNVKLQCFAMWIDPDERTMPLQQAMNLADTYFKMLKENPYFVPFSRDFDENGDKIATVLTIEGGEAIAGREENLRVFYNMGVRAMTLTWNATNELGFPAMRKGSKGLTKLGKKIVGEMDRIGMALDLAHLNDAGIDDALSLYTKPIMASHSNARAVFEHKRSLSDEHIKAIAKSGGFIGVNYYPPQLCSNSKEASSKHIADHIEHIINIGGINCVGLGSDFDGMTKVPQDVENPSEVPNIFEELKKRGFSDSDIKRISYDNLKEYLLNFC